MRILAVDTATQRCSVALLIQGTIFERSADTLREHADLILPLVDEVLQEAGVGIRDLDAIAYGRGPGAFTGVRIAVGVAQGLAFGTDLPTVGISDLAAVAQQVARPNATVLACMDARMSEVYWGVFQVDERGTVQLDASERVTSPTDVTAENVTVGAGTGFRAYPQLGSLVVGGLICETTLPRAREIAALAEGELSAGRGRSAAEAVPVYLRDRVTFVKEM